MKIIQNAILLSAILALVCTGCDTKIEPIPVESPLNQVDESAMKEYKRDILSRPATVVMHYKWGTLAGYNLYNLPEMVDVVVLKENHEQPNDFLLRDLRLAQEQLHMAVLSSVDFNAIDETMELEAKREIKKRRLEIKASWGDQIPSEEEQDQIFAELEQKVVAEFHAKGVEIAKKNVSDLLSNLERIGYDGISAKMPEKFLIVSREDVTTLLDQIVAKCGGNDKPYLLIETPFEEGRTQIEKATWVVYSRKSLDHRLADFDVEASTWATCRYLPSVDLSDAKNKSGYSDSKIFSPEGVIPREKEIIYWQAPNKAGVAYYHPEKDAFNMENGLPYAYFRELLNLYISLNK